MGFDKAINFIRKFRDAFGGWFFVVGLGGDKGDNIADFAFDIGAVTILFRDAASVDGGGALELAEGFTEGLVATAEDPVDNLTFAHGEEVVHREVAADDHGFEDVGDEL